MVKSIVLLVATLQLYVTLFVALCVATITQSSETVKASYKNNELCR